MWVIEVVKKKLSYNTKYNNADKKRKKKDCYEYYNLFFFYNVGLQPP